MMSKDRWAIDLASRLSGLVGLVLVVAVGVGCPKDAGQKDDAPATSSNASEAEGEASGEAEGEGEAGGEPEDEEAEKAEKQVALDRKDANTLFERFYEGLKGSEVAATWKSRASEGETQPTVMKRPVKSDVEPESAQAVIAMLTQMEARLVNDFPVAMMHQTVRGSKGGTPKPDFVMTAAITRRDEAKSPDDTVVYRVTFQVVETSSGEVAHEETTELSKSL